MKIELNVDSLDDVSDELYELLVQAFAAKAEKTGLKFDSIDNIVLECEATE